jgi:predicted transcriptional regulator
MAEYTEAFRDRMVQRMTGERGLTATALAKEVGVPQPTLSRWLKDAATVAEVAKKKSKKAKAPKSVSPRRPSEVSAEDKVRVVLEAGALDEAELGAFLRREGLHEEDLERFRDEVRQAAVSGLKAPKKPRASEEQKRIKELERDLKRSQAALAETAALLVLRKKAVALWGEEGEDT